MVLKNLCLAVIGTFLLASGGPSVADENRAAQYRSYESFSLDLAKAVLSPKRLGPAAEFAPVAVEAKADARTTAKSIAEATVRPNTVAHTRAARPHSAVRTRLARRHGNPLDAEARDTRIQVWPCRSGGICNWRR